MAENKQDKVIKEQLVLQELGQNPFQKFNTAFALMSIIPFLVFFWILGAKLFNINVFVGDVGLFLFVSLVVSVTGFAMGYRIIKNILNMIILYAAQKKQSDALKSTFVANVSHELKSPLAIIKINTSAMIDGVLGAVSEPQGKQLRLCSSMIDRMSGLINDLLDVYKIEAGLVELKLQQFDLEALLDKQIKTFELAAANKRIKINTELKDKELTLWVDEARITQVLTNLMSNAVKYTPDDGTITLRAFPTWEFIRFEIMDTANKIPPDKFNTIFDKFQRLDTKKEGTGLGLAITKDIVELHKGKIWVENNTGPGNKFIVILPRDPREKEKKGKKKNK
ncbi:MAG: HAMP domain-containing sensor histidine kinase [Candidatus Omnitrophica bacterium]|nr:HAMP domain-containing sensor histidine kinase [Candidatus Omnitrophota bacterium]